MPPKEKFYNRKQPPKYYQGRSKLGPNPRVARAGLDAADRLGDAAADVGHRAAHIGKRVARFVDRLTD
jgi:hypothetical protein